MIRGWHLREGQREVEALSQASEHDERTGREGARCHLAARAFEGAARRALAAEAAVGPVGTGAPVAADAGDAASSLGVQLTVFSYGGVTPRREVSAPPARTPAGPAPPKTPSPLKGRAPCGHAPCQPGPSPRSQWPDHAPRARPLHSHAPFTASVWRSEACLYSFSASCSRRARLYHFRPTRPRYAQDCRRTLTRTVVPAPAPQPAHL